MNITRFEKIRASVWFKLGKVLVILVASAGLVNHMFRTSLQAKWSFVDDQEIAYYLGSDRKLTLPEAWHIYFNETEIGKYGSYARFRPAYFAFRLLESWLWRDNLIAWHLTKLGIFTIFIVVFWYLLAEKIGFLVGGLLTFFMAASYYWIDVFVRLGPSEPYGVFGLAAFALGVYFLYYPWNVNLSWFLICTGVMIMTGSKENLFPVLILFILIVFDRFKKHMINLWGWLWIGLTALWNVWILSSILIAIGKTGRDIYQQSVSPADRSWILLTALKRWEVAALVGLCLLFLVIGFFTGRRDGQIAGRSIALGASLSFLLIVYLTQFLIYGRDFPNGDRYDFPGLLVGPLTIALLIWYFQQITWLDKWRVYGFIVSGTALLVSAALAYSQMDGIKLARRESRKYVQATNEFTQDVQKLQSLVERYPDYTLIFQANTPISDYLFAFIYNPFLRYYGVSNPMSVLWAGGSLEAYDASEASFIHDLENASLYGGAVLTNVSLKPDFVPLSQIDGQNCVLLLLSSNQPAKDCLAVYRWNQ